MYRLVAFHPSRSLSIEPVADGLEMSSAQGRTCGDCSLCCLVLRVDELGKLGGTPCVHQDIGTKGCSIHARRPGICRAYRCLWLSGGLEDDDRPDRLGAVLDVVAEGPVVRLEIRESRPGVFDVSERLAAIAEGYCASMPVRITDVGDVMDPDRSHRLLLPGGEEHRVDGDWTEVRKPGQAPYRQRLPWLERSFRRLLLGVRRAQVKRIRWRSSVPADPANGTPED